MSESKTATNADPNATPLPAETKPALAAGLFKPFTLGSTLEQGPVGNVIRDVKRSPMDYERTYQNSTKNQTIAPEDLAKLGEGEVKKAVRKNGSPAPAKKSMTNEEILAAVPEDQREAIMAEFDRRIDEARKSNKEDEAQRIEKAKDKAKKCYGPQMNYKQPKASDLK